MESFSPRSDASQLYQAWSLAQSSQTRVLLLNPSAQGDAQLTASFEVIDLKDGIHETLQYEALSYVWGQSDASRVIRIGSHSLPITEHLHGILTYLRLIAGPRRLWIDAICINQQNDVEKAAQVACMARIYSKADRVLAWVAGLEALPIAHIIDVIADHAANFGFEQDIDHLVRRTKRDNGFAIYGMSEGNTEAIERTRWGDDILLINELPLIIYPLREIQRQARDVAKSCPQFLRAAMDKSMLALYSSSWFSRVWILQEGISARHLLLCYGGEEIKWTRFATAVYLTSLVEHDDLSSTKAAGEFQHVLDFVMLRLARQIYAHPRTFDSGPMDVSGEPNTIASRRTADWTSMQMNSILQRVQDADPKPLRHELFRTGDYAPVATIMRSMRRRYCRDDRDRLFGALGIFPTDLQITTRPDYSKLPAEVYTQWAREMLSMKRVDMLNEAGMFGRIDSPHDPSDPDQLPSWVPEYRKSRLRCFGELRWLETEMNRLWDLCTPQLRLSEDPSLRHRLEIQAVSVGQFQHSLNLGKRPFAAIPVAVSVLSQLLVSRDAQRRGPLFARKGAESQIQSVLNVFAAFINSMDELGIKGLPHTTATFDGLTVKTQVELEYDKGYNAASITSHEAWARYTFFTTKNGHVGFAPCSLPQRSKIIAFVGLPSPYVIAPTANALEWRLLGPCYIEGMMKRYGGYGDDYHFVTLV